MPTLIDLLSGVGNVLDTPGRFARTALAGRNPFETVFDPSKGVSGRDLLQQYGMVGENQDGLDGGDIGGFMAEMALDPTNLIGGGLLARLMGKAGKAKAARRAIFPDASDILSDISTTNKIPIQDLRAWDKHARRVRAAEKDEGLVPFSDTAKATQTSGMSTRDGWREFSKARGYTDSEISDFSNFLDATYAINRRGAAMDDLSAVEHAHQVARENPLPSAKPLLAALLGQNAMARFGRAGQPRN